MKSDLIIKNNKERVIRVFKKYLEHNQQASIKLPRYPNINQKIIAQKNKKLNQLLVDNLYQASRIENNFRFQIIVSKHSNQNVKIIIDSRHLDSKTTKKSLKEKLENII